MDKTKEYIRMCEHAVEIQGGYISDDYDICFHKGIIGTRRSQLPGGGGSDIFIKRVEFGYVSKLRPKEWNDYCIWLPRQDQLQDMVKNEEEFGCDWSDDLIDRFYYWHSKYGVANWSMEQLWLSFVMFEKYSKRWAGKDWEAIYHL